MAAQLLIQLPHRAAGFHRHHPGDRIQLPDRPQATAEHHHSALQRHALAVIAGTCSPHGERHPVLDTHRRQPLHRRDTGGTHHQLRPAGRKTFRQHR